MLSPQRGTILSLPNDVEKSCPSKAQYVRLLGAQPPLRDVHEQLAVSRIQAVGGLSDRLLVQGYNADGYERTIDSHIKNLRKEIAEHLSEQEAIATVHGVGYKLGVADRAYQDDGEWASTCFVAT